MKKKVSFPFSFLLFLLLSIFFFLFGLFLFLTREFPDLKALKTLKHKPISVIYDINDQPAYLILPEKRIVVSSIPSHVKDAFLAAEDADFFKHGPLDFTSILRATWINLKYGKVLQGGSTITQQLVKTLILGPEKSLLRKMKEAILAYRVERYLSKEEILNLYLNSIYMGHGIYGVEAASLLYFGKNINQLSKAEAALLAGIVRAPALFSPKNHPGLAKERQRYVIEQMAKKGFIKEKEKRAMLKDPIVIKEDDGLLREDYFKDYVVRYVEEKYGKGIFSKHSLRIYSTCHRGLQRYAEEALKKGLFKYEQRMGEFKSLRHLKREEWEEFKEIKEKDLRISGLSEGKIYELLVTERIREGYKVYLGKKEGLLKIDLFPFKAGDIVKGVYIGKRKDRLHFLPVRSLEDIEGALVAFDVRNGYVLAIVGGKNFKEGPFNRAIFSKIQPGSAFKPFVYLAALRKGYTPDTIVLDEPKAYVGSKGTWVPKNYDGKYDGQISLRDALAFSKNAATVRILEDIGIESLIDTIKDIGLRVKIPYDLTSALGTAEISLFELTRGFLVFATGGYSEKPIFIRKIVDEKGRVLEENEPQRNPVIEEEVAKMMEILLRAPVEYGTAKAASSLGYPLSGKTGTSDDYKDALFVGYSPSICTGVWVGFDKRRSLGEKESGARIALPIWMDFMAYALRFYMPVPQE